MSLVHEGNVLVETKEWNAIVTMAVQVPVRTCHTPSSMFHFFSCMVYIWVLDANPQIAVHEIKKRAKPPVSQVVQMLHLPIPWWRLRWHDPNSHSYRRRGPL